MTNLAPYLFAAFLAFGILRLCFGFMFPNRITYSSEVSDFTEKNDA